MQEKCGFQCTINLFNKACMEIGEQIIKGAHEMGKYCTVHSRGVARKRYCWVSQWAIHRLWEEVQWKRQPRSLTIISVHMVTTITFINVMLKATPVQNFEAVGSKTEERVSTERQPDQATSVTRGRPKEKRYVRNVWFVTTDVQKSLDIFTFRCLFLCVFWVTTVIYEKENVMKQRCCNQ